MKALWLPYEVAAPADAAAYYTDHFGLPVVDTFDGGLVLGVRDDVFLELAVPGAGAPASVAVELADAAAVDTAYRAFRPAPPPPRRFPRGHYGFDAPAPGPGRIMVWSSR